MKVLGITNKKAFHFKKLKEYDRVYCDIPLYFKRKEDIAKIEEFIREVYFIKGDKMLDVEILIPIPENDLIRKERGMENAVFPKKCIKSNL